MRTCQVRKAKGHLQHLSCVYLHPTLLVIIFVYKYISIFNQQHITNQTTSNTYTTLSLSLIVWPPIPVAEGSPPQGSESPTGSGLPTHLLSLQGVLLFLFTYLSLFFLLIVVMLANVMIFLASRVYSVNFLSHYYLLRS